MTSVAFPGCVADCIACAASKPGRFTDTEANDPKKLLLENFGSQFRNSNPYTKF